MQEKHEYDEFKPENQLINPKVPQTPYEPGSSLLAGRASTHPEVLVSREIIYTVALNLLDLQLIPLRSCPFFITESAPGISLRCFIDETPLLKLPKRSLADRA